MLWLGSDMPTRAITSFACVAVLSAVFATPSMANLVTNPGFEMGNFSGWIQSGNTEANAVGTGVYAHTGTFGAQLGPVGSDWFLVQILPTTIGTTYDISFWLRNDGGTPNDFSAS